MYGNPWNRVHITTGSPSSKYERRRASALLRNICNIRICMGKKPIVSVTYENETISIKNSLPYLKCVLRLSCVVHGPIYGHFMGFYVNGFLYFVGYRNDRFFFHTNPYILNVTQQCRCSTILIGNSSLGYIWYNSSRCAFYIKLCIPWTRFA